MTRDALYNAAFRYKKTRLWKKLWDSDIFALKLSSGRTGYISVMGNVGEHCAIALYTGEEEFRTYQRMQMQNFRDFDGNDFDMFEKLLMQKCLQIVFETKDMLLDREVQEVRAAAKANGVRLGGKNAYPHFLTYRPYYYPWPSRKQEEIDALYEAAEACILLAEELEEKKPENLGIAEIGREGGDVPLFALENGKLKKCGRIPVPDYEEETFADLVPENEVGIASVKRLPKSGVGECHLIRLMKPVKADPPEEEPEIPWELRGMMGEAEEEDLNESAPYFPVMMLCVDRDSGYIYHCMPVMDFETYPEDVLNKMEEAFRNEGRAPAELWCGDDRTAALLRNFCASTGIRLKTDVSAMEMLEEAEKSLAYNMNDENYEEDVMQQIDDLIRYVMESPVEELRNMPEEMEEAIAAVLEMGFLDPETEKAMRWKLRQINRL